MKKIILSVIFLVFGLMISIPGVIAGDGDEIEFISPEDNQHIMGDFLVEWTNPERFPGIVLQFKSGDGNWQDLTEGMPGDQLDFLLETEDFVEGLSSLRLQQDTTTHDTVLFTIDNTSPEADVMVLQNGAESDEQTDETETVIAVEISEENGLSSCEISWGDESPNTDCLFEIDRELEHQYADNGAYEVVLTVEDLAGNEDSDSVNANVENVDPVCLGIEGPTEGPIGLELTFEGSATDVDADADTLIYTWDFDDGSDGVEGNPVSHIYETAGDFTIMLEVEDKDSGTSNICEYEVNAIDPIVLSDQQVAAYHELSADFGGETENVFPTGLTGEVTCEKFESENPEGFTVGTDGTSCTVQWGGHHRPTNDQRTGDQREPWNINIKVSNGTDVEYYTFEITVYSWIIPLQEGWNLVSIPLVPESNLIEDVILDQIQEDLPSGTFRPIWSYQYDSEDGMSEWFSSRRSGVGDLNTINPGYSYWIKVVRDTEIKGFGDLTVDPEDGPPGSFPVITIPTGAWSMVGRYGILGNLNPKQAGALSIETAMESILRFREENIIHLYDEDSSRVDEVDHYRGYWVWVTREGGSNDMEEEYTPLDDFYPEN